MKLFLNKTSPYARAVRILMLEKGLEDRVELCWCDPWTDDAQLLEANPVGRVPALITDNGTSISESLLIAFYIDSLSSQLPSDNKEDNLHLASIGQGLMEAAFALVISRKYKDEGDDESVLTKRRISAIERSLLHLEQSIALISCCDISSGTIIIAVALDYLAFRLPELGADKRYPELEVWRANVVSRPSFKNTAFG
ncbi:glutathione S-transferase N-terminal domain-containing protein [Endozoicomonas euniceicola]|uniref:Glutathione S-transferase N-terminal domain-containing protein n=1 Tax=Endozoicomonas euniceicola TaxID=1234143 RepID=A0ABY6GYF5_9GAMM|nr:glutathione S-transferase N-terminal domain-containing protein [Endozoicomonas euniceicola]UYM17815.1 glutathione S-transferase N-terminal domain-containing protein [Endozoicomonas euniceicola]